MPDFRADIIRAVGGKATPQTLNFVGAWAAGEGGHFHNAAKYNWLNRTGGSPNTFTSSNGAKIDIYPNYTTGVSKTSDLIKDGYSNITKALRTGNINLNDPGVQQDLAKWVNGPNAPVAKAQGYFDSLASRMGAKNPTIAFDAAPSQAPGAAGLTTQARSQVVTGLLEGLMAQNPLRTLKVGDFDNPSLRSPAKITANLTPLMQAVLAAKATAQPDAEAGAALDDGSLQPAANSKGNLYKSKNPVVNNILARAHSQIGQKYVWGAESRAEGGFDCSGLIWDAYKAAGVPLRGRVTGDMIHEGTPVKWGQFKPGDLIFSNHGGHVTMYVGGGQVIAAPHKGTVVQYQPVDRFKGSFVAARRIIPNA